MRISRPDECFNLPLRSILRRRPSPATSGDCGLDIERGGGPLKPRPRKGETLPVGKLGVALSGLAGLDSASITKLERRCALPENVDDGAIL